mgnify:CR=1 FL=1
MKMPLRVKVGATWLRSAKASTKGFFDKIKEPEWKPDYGPSEMNAVSGCSAVGARVPLIAFNVNLHTPDVEIAQAIAKKSAISAAVFTMSRPLA